jgi:molybdopterin-guanine dinucleotide biosynthesis protein A
VTYDGVVLAGGAGRRLGGRHKPAIPVGGRRLIDVALGALGGAAQIVAVGPPLPTTQPIVWTRESPPGSGPVAAIQATLPLLHEGLVVVLAADLPFVTAEAVDRLVDAQGDAAVTMAVDDTGQEQPLLACYDVRRLAAAMPSVARDTSMRSLLRELGGLGETRRIALGGDPPATWDCDTAADLIRTEELA